MMPMNLARRMPARRSGQHGVALLEILGALAIGAIMVLGLSSAMDTSLEDIKGQQASYYQAQIAEAGQKYIAANSDTLQRGTALVAVGVEQLKAGNFLSASIGATNVYGQTPCVLIRAPDPAAKPGQFDALVVTSGGLAIADRVIAVIAANAGPGGGYISGTDSGNAKGASWSSSTAAYRGVSCAGGRALSGGRDDGGHLATNLFYDGSGQLATDFLYRSAVPGRPELNRMNTPIRMASMALVSLGTPCRNTPGVAEILMALDSTTRALAVCGAAGVWVAPGPWKEPVNAFADLPPSGEPGDVHMVRTLARAFTWNGTRWAALAVDENGHLSVPGRLTAANVYATSNIVADGTIDAMGDIRTIGSVGAGVDVNAARDVNAVHAVNTFDLNAQHNVVTNGLQVNTWASTPAISIHINWFAAGAVCHYLEYNPTDDAYYVAFPIGTVAMDANYVPLICGLDKTMRYANGTYAP